jgi:deoxyribonuclease-4
VGAEALQTFVSNPRGWAIPALDRAALARAGAAVREAGLGPLFVHAPYLVNPASPSAAFRERSVAVLGWTLDRAAALGAEGVVVHAGSAGGAPRREALRRLRDALLPLLEGPGPALVIELTAGGAGAVASRWPEAAEALHALDAHPRVGFCLDTCHAFAAGYDLSTDEGLRRCLAELRREVGEDRLLVVHANDSRDPLGSRRDRHAHLGRGRMGLEGFRALVRSRLARRVPIVVETPPAGQAADIALLRRLAGTSPA